MSLSTHVLDATTGRPAVGVQVTLQERRNDTWAPLAQAQTDDDGRIRSLGLPGVGVYRICFDTDSYFGGATFYPEVIVVFEIVDASAHHHVPLLLSPFGYTTYRGS
jgi:5-hydroxyisourate hydrolase